MGMADVTPSEEKLGEAIGLADAAQEAAKEVASLQEDDAQAGEFAAAEDPESE